MWHWFTQLEIAWNCTQFTHTLTGSGWQW